MNIILCNHCQGQRLVHEMGGKIIKCPKCLGTGRIEFENESEQHNNSDDKVFAKTWKREHKKTKII